jgi:hypothetical protein
VSIKNVGSRDKKDQDDFLLIKGFKFFPQFYMQGPEAQHFVKYWYDIFGPFYHSSFTYTIMHAKHSVAKWTPL